MVWLAYLSLSTLKNSTTHRWSWFSKARRMYGDCQVMSSMGGNVVVNSDTLFSSSIQNSNFNFIPTMPFQPFPSMVIINSSTIFLLHVSVQSLSSCLWFPLLFLKQKEEDGMLRGKEEMESGSGSEQVEDKSGNEQESEQPTKKKRYHRHTARQIQEMEAWGYAIWF